jgi:hypothetical protein
MARTCSNEAGLARALSGSHLEILRGPWRPAPFDGRLVRRIWPRLSRHRPIHYHRARLAAREIACRRHSTSLNALTSAQ